MGDILSQEEINALLSATDDDAPRAKQAASSDDGSSPSDGGPGSAGVKALRFIESLHSRYVETLSQALTRELGQRVRVKTVFVDQALYREFVMSLSNPSCTYHFSPGHGRGRVVVDVMFSVVFSIVDRVFGGSGSPQGVEGRRLTPLERGIVDEIFRPVIHEIPLVWQRLGPMAVSGLELDTTPEFVGATGPADAVVIVALEVDSQAFAGLVTLAYPLSVIASLFEPYPWAWPWFMSRMSEGERVDDLLSSARNARVTIEMARGRARARRLQDAQVGDVMRFFTALDEPCIVRIDGVPVCSGRLCQHDGQLLLVPQDRKEAEGGPARG